MFRRTARSLAYLGTSLLAAPAGLLWTLATTVLMAVGGMTALGAPVFLGITWLDRRIASAERRRAAWMLGTPIPDPYQPLTGDRRARVRQIAAQPATWRDMAWFVLLFPVGLTFGIAAVVPTAVTVAGLLAPAWAWAVPQRTAYPLIKQAMGTDGGRILISLAAVALSPLVMWLLQKLAALQARIAAALLSPGEHGRLVHRAQQLASTRAGVVDAQAAELRRIERDLHDGAQARIVAAGMTLALAERRARGGAVILDDVTTARLQLDEALSELRRLVRGIHPPILTDRGLAAAVAALAADCPIPVSVTVELPERLAPAVESAAYFVVAEGLANAIKHSSASAGDVTLTQGSVLTVEVTDDGAGGADPGGSGLDGLRRRVEALDGTFTVSSPPGGPTRLTAELPCVS